MNRLGQSLMRIAAIQSDGSLAVEERPIPTIGNGELLLQVMACGLCGTDILKFQKRNLPSGTVLGHEVAGIVVEVRSEKGFAKGDRVLVAHHVPCGQCHYCRHGSVSMCEQFKKTNLDPGGFAEFLRIPAKHVQNTALKIPESLSFEEASFAEPLACCVRAFQRSELLKGDSILVVGLGSIGLMLVQMFVAYGMKVSATDLMPERCDLAQKFGASLFDSKTRPTSKFDMVMLTAGNPPLLTQTLEWVRSGGTIHFFSSLSAEGPIPFDFNQVYHRELKLLSTYSSSPDSLKEALKLLTEQKVQVKDLITLRSSLEELGVAVSQALSRKTLKAVIYPQRGKL